MSKRVELLKKAREEAKENVKSLTKDIAEALKLTFLKCESCDKKSRVDQCTGVDLKWYDENTGSPCGGFWTHWKYCWRCPKCGHTYKNEFKDERNYWELYSSFFDKIEVLHGHARKY